MRLRLALLAVPLAALLLGCATPLAASAPQPPPPPTPTPTPNPPVVQAPQYQLAATLKDPNGFPLKGFEICLGSPPVQACGVTDVNGNTDINVTHLPAGQYDYWVFNPGSSKSDNCVQATGLLGGSTGQCNTITVTPGATPTPVTVTYSPPPDVGVPPSGSPPQPATGMYWECAQVGSIGAINATPPAVDSPFCASYTDGADTLRVSQGGTFAPYWAAACPRTGWQGAWVVNIILPDGSTSDGEQYRADANWDQAPNYC